MTLAWAGFCSTGRRFGRMVNIFAGRRCVRCGSPIIDPQTTCYAANTFITVVESAELRDCNDVSDAQRLSRKGTLLAEAQVGSRVLVVAEITRQRSFEVAGVSQ